MGDPALISTERWTAFVERRHRAIVLASLLISLLSGISLRWLRLDFDVLGMLPRGRPAFDNFATFVTDFGELNELLVLITASPNDSVPLATLQAFADAFGARLAELDTVAQVQVRLDMDRLLEGVLGQYLFNYLPDAGYDVLETRLSRDGIDAQLAANRTVLSAPFDLSAVRAIREDPFGLRRFVGSALTPSSGLAAPAYDGYLVAPGGRALLVVVRPTSSAFDTVFGARLLKQVGDAEALARQQVPAAGVRVAYTGSYVYAIEDAGTLRWDVRRYSTMALAGVLAVFYLGYRNLRAIPFIVYPMIVGTLFTFGLDLLVYGRLNALSTAFAAILYGLSIDTGIHFYNRLLEERARADLRTAMARTLAGLGRANLAVCTTSSVVFVLIGFSSITGLSQLGFLTAFGVMLNIGALYLLYPAAAFWFPRLVDTPLVSVETPRLAGLAALVVRWARPVAIGIVVVGLGLLVAAARVELDVRLMHLRPPASTAARVQDEIEALFGKQGLGGSVLIQRPGLETALADTETVTRQLAAYQSEELLDSYQAITGVLPSEQTQHERLERYRRLPRAAAMQYFREALPRYGFTPGPFKEFIAGFEADRERIVRLDTPALAPLESLIDRYVRVHSEMATVATYVEPGPGKSLSSLEERLHRDLPELRTIVTGRSLLEDELHRVLRRELALFTALALLGNFILLLATLGNARDAIVVLAPVIWAVAALLAGVHWAGAAIDPVNLIVPTLILGLGVDYGSYLVPAARERGGITAAIRASGRALIVTGFTTIAGFGCLSLSRYPALSRMGLLAAIGLLLALLVSIVLLPALWAVTRRPRQGRES